MVAHDISILLDLKLQEEWRGGARLCGSNDAGREIVRAGPEVVGTKANGEIKVLEYVEEEGSDATKQRQASGLLKYFQSFDSAFFLHMMMIILALTNGLSKTFQRKDMDIVNAISDVESAKRELDKLRSEHGWNPLLSKVCSFCNKNDISVMDMEKEYANPKKPRQRTGINNEHHYRVDCFFAVLDLLVEELNHRFNEVNNGLLCCMFAFNPSCRFSHYDDEKLMKLAKFYPNDFSDNELDYLEKELCLYIDNVRNDTRFASLETINDLAKLMVSTKKHNSYPFVYRLLKLVLTLPVATATVERCFSAMKLVKNALRNKMGDDYLSNSLIGFVEKEMLDTIPNEVIVKRFHAKNHRGMKRKELEG
ncbi:uncharacterized protein LOC119300157 [Triticum dicoccoides]|uniref:uncharacterized protein LOC119300157 n=1 Tax=Triticum dicoccoides TaxID=85692 RepID=UPI00188F8478|nr:uncharacterized protein LOC119300157 [Triticum dicoccoides]